MKRLTLVAPVLALALAFATAYSQDGATETSAKTVVNGVFSAEQVERGRTVYDANCSSCHGPQLGGSAAAPGLSGVGFVFFWKDQTLGDLYEYMHSTMPLGRPGSLSAQQYTDILALILESNGYPAGDAELPSDPVALEQITIVEPAQ